MTDKAATDAQGENVEIDYDKQTSKGKYLKYEKFILNSFLILKFQNQVKLPLK